MPKSKNTSLQQCIKLLNNRDHNNPPPLSCYRLLDFPREPRNKTILQGPHYTFIQKLFGSNKIGITKPLYVQAKQTIWVPPNFLKSIENHRQRYLIIPVQFKYSNNSYAILYDKKRSELQVFIPPGSRPVNNHQKLELKFRDLFIDRLSMPIKLFYHTITYGPPPNSYHADFWPSWLIVQRIKSGLERESLINIALEKLLTQSPEYSRFVQAYTKYITRN